MSKCAKYNTSRLRIERCEDIGLCSICSSASHLKDKCTAPRRGLRDPCIYCNSKGHVSPLCPNEIAPPSSTGTRPRHRRHSEDGIPKDVKSHIQYLSLSAGNNSSCYILPTMTLKVRKGNKTVPIRVLLDLGSQRSYFHTSVMDKLGVKTNSLPSFKNTVKTFIGEEERPMSLAHLEMKICCGNYTPLPVFVDPSLDVDFYVKGFAGAIYNVSAHRYKLADRTAGQLGDTVTDIEGLLGIDALQHLKHLQVNPCIKGTALDTCRGFIPFGPVEKFLTPSQYGTIFRAKRSAAPSNSASSKGS